MARPFSLLEEFRRSAFDLPRGGKTADDLIALYRQLPEEDRPQGAQALLDCGMQFMRNFVPPKKGNWLGQVVPGNVAAILKTLREPECLRYVARPAAGDLADIAEQLLVRAQSVTTAEVSETSIDRFRNAMIEFARDAIAASNAIRTAEPFEPAVAVNTGRDIAPLKPLVLKPGEPRP